MATPDITVEISNLDGSFWADISGEVDLRRRNLLPRNRQVGLPC